MTAILKNVLQLAESWPGQDQKELARRGLMIELHRRGFCQPMEEKLKSIEEVLPVVRNDEEIEALFIKYLVRVR